MPIAYLVRHGRAAAGFGEATDPGLDDLGHRQAAAVTARLAPSGPLDLVSSSLRRARETAAPLAAAWNRAPRIEPRIAEIPSPTGELAARATWLCGLMDQSWDGLDDSLHDWRQGILDTLGSLDDDTVLVTHFMVINVAAGAALADDRLVVFRPDNASVTEIEVTGTRLRLRARGATAQTTVG